MAVSIRKLNKLIEDNPNNADYYVERGKYYSKKYHYDNAIEDYSNAIRIDANLQETYELRVDAYIKVYKYEQALQDCTILINFNPENIEYYKKRINVYQLIMNKLSFIAEDCERIIELSEDKGEAYFYAAKVYGGITKRLKYLEKAIEYSPDNYEYYKYRVQLFENNYPEKFESLIDDYNKMIELKPDNADTYFKKAALYEKLAKYDKALGIYQYMLDKNIDDSALYKILYIHTKLENYQTVIEIAEKYPNDRNVFEYKIKVLKAISNRNSEILKEYKKLAKSSKKLSNNEYYYEQAKIYESLGNYNKALENINFALDNCKETCYWEYLLKRANILEHLSRYDAAIEDYKKLTKLKFVDGMQQLIKCEQNAEMTEEAEKDFNKLLEYFTDYINLFPDDYPLYVQRGKFYKAFDYIDKATQDFQSAVQLISFILQTEPSNVENEYITRAWLYKELGYTNKYYADVEILSSLHPYNKMSNAEIIDLVDESYGIVETNAASLLKSGRKVDF